MRNERPARAARALTKLLLAALVLLPTHAALDASAQRRAKKTARQTPSAKPSTGDPSHPYACPMHPEVTSKTAGAKCPKCGMNLTKRDGAAGDGAASSSASDEGMMSSALGGGANESVASLTIPDTVVYDQNGRRLNFHRDLVKGKTVAINFIFTTCTTICPPLAATFARVQQELGERAGKEVSLISISVDPVTDTPERLKEFAGKFKAGPGWTFVTGGEPEIDALLTALGAASPDKNDHTPLVLVGNEAAGKWTRTYGLAPPSSILKVIDEAASAAEAASVAALPTAPSRRRR